MPLRLEQVRPDLKKLMYIYTQIQIQSCAAESVDVAAGQDGVFFIGLFPYTYVSFDTTKETYERDR